MFTPRLFHRLCVLFTTPGLIVGTLVPGLTERLKNDYAVVDLSLLHICWMTSRSSSETGKGVIATRAQSTVSWLVTGLFDWWSSPSLQTWQKWRLHIHVVVLHLQWLLAGGHLGKDAWKGSRNIPWCVITCHRLKVPGDVMAGCL